MLGLLLQSWPSVLLVALVAAIFRHGKILLIAVQTFPRDFKLVSRALRFQICLKWYEWRNLTAGKLMEKNVARVPDKVCFFHGDEVWTFRQVNDLSNKLAHYFESKGYKKGDVVALLMDNRPEYPCVWLGLSKVGIVSALINYNLRLRSLLHCIQVANAKAVVYGKEFAPAVQEVLDMGELQGVELFSFDNGASPVIPSAIYLQKELRNASTANPKAKSSYFDQLCYVYTSGTTGLPKAAVIKHHRLMMAAMGAHYMNDCRADDVFLTPLPLYHMAGGMLAVGQAVIYSTTVVIIKKFSASRFWDDCIRYNVTVTQYLGELCRFLLSQPEKPQDKQHQIRLVMGNGLRVEIWEDFVKRFNIPQIVEFYGATEGNCSLSNLVGHVGAVGFLPRILLPILPMALVRVDEFTGEPIRNPKTGLAIRCQPGELGEMMAVIKKNHPIRDFPGYTDAASSNKKILHDVFNKGDIVFRAGDIMVMDDYGYFYFRDRVGDTFRWKGENVSTMEVEAVVGSCCDLKDTVVYGVELKGMDGRAGMAAISDPEKNLDLVKLTEGIIKSLPPYARPVFIRVLERSAELTGTFKLRKVDLQKEGINPEVVKDKIYVFLGDKYTLLDADLHAKIGEGKLRL